MARNRNRGDAAPSAAKGDEIEADLAVADDSEVPGTVETTDAPPVEGEKVGDVEAAKGDEIDLTNTDPPAAPKSDPPPPVDPPNHDGDEPEPTPFVDGPRIRQLTHDEEVKAEKAFRLAMRAAKHEGHDEPTEEDLVRLRRQIARDIIADPKRFDAIVAAMRSRLPKLPVRTYRVWAGGEFHHDGKRHLPGAELQFPAELAENYPGVLEPIDEE